MKIALPRVFVVLLLLAASSASAVGSLTYFALQQTGQATVAVDEDQSIAYIVDLGKSGDGDQVLLDGVPLLERLHQLSIRKLVFECSHRHSDHMGGIVALLKNDANFFPDGDRLQPRFESITVIDDSSKNTLALLLEKLAVGSSLKTKHIDLAPKVDKKTGKIISAGNGYEKISRPSDSIHIETIPYPASEKGGAHGRAIVTLVTIDGKYRVLDFDDASNAVIGKVVNNLQARRLTIDAFVAPHHGSKAHDVTPILAGLHPRVAIISANEENMYGHPSAPILRVLLEKLNPENVIFTGSERNLKIGGGGIIEAPHTAADPDAYALLVASSRQWDEKQHPRLAHAGRHHPHHGVRGHGDGKSNVVGVVYRRRDWNRDRLRRAADYLAGVEHLRQGGCGYDRRELRELPHSALLRQRAWWNVAIRLEAHRPAGSRAYHNIKDAAASGVGALHDDQ